MKDLRECFSVRIISHVFHINFHKLVLFNSQGYSKFRLFWKYAEIGYFGLQRLHQNFLLPFQSILNQLFW